MIDIRMNKVTETFWLVLFYFLSIYFRESFRNLKINFLKSSEDFKVSYDYSRAIFSPDVDHQYVSAGSADGSVIIWNSSTGKVEKTLKEHK